MNKSLLAIAALLSATAGCLDQSGPDGDDGLSTTTQEIKRGGTCRIDGVAYGAGAVDPSDACRSCEPAIDKRAWTVLDATCYDAVPSTCQSNRDCGGQACIDGVCTLACTLDTQCGPPLHCVVGSGCML